MVVLAIAILFSLSLAVMLYFSRQALKQEALQTAEQTLEGTVQHIDNILLSVEQSLGNVYWEMLGHLDDQKGLYTYCQRIVECNPYIVGCAVALKPYYYPDRELFMAYVHRQGYKFETNEGEELVRTDTFAGKPYTQQQWYSTPMETGRARWTDPLKDDDAEGEALTSFCLPLYNREGKVVGVVAADVSIGLLSQIVLASKPSTNGYSVLLDSKGSYIVHPDTEKLMHETVFTQTEGRVDPSVKEAARAMLAGEEGYKRFTMDGHVGYVFYKPFLRADVPGRAMEKLGWSTGVVYPEKDIFGEYNQLLYYVLGIAVVGLLLFFVLCWRFIHRQLLPLQLLTTSAQRIAEGNYNEPIPTTHREDEIGQLQDCFQQMQQSLSVQVGELEQLLATLQERGEELRKMYGQAQEADRMKTAFLHNMTNQMMEPAMTIADSVDRMVAGDCNQETDTIKQQSKAITDVLSRLLEAADSEQGKEVAHE
jgi:methyl-accepting chemotaxis protein/sigma-B regulation protein RsbU (phosphoserine phosphatase)